MGQFIAKALVDDDILVHGDGSQLRAWCYIDDFFDAIVACLSKDEAVGNDYNLGNALATVTIYDLASRIVRLTRSSSRIVTTPHTYTDISVRMPNSLKAAEDLGYRPKYDIEAALSRTIEWYHEHLQDFLHWTSQEYADSARLPVARLA